MGVTREHEARAAAAFVSVWTRQVILLRQEGESFRSPAAGVEAGGIGSRHGSTRWGVGRVRHRAAAGGRTEAEKQKNGYREVVAIKKQKNAAAL
jgi:hypothetical protein